jgi:hypothetical protein
MVCVAAKTGAPRRPRLFSRGKPAMDRRYPDMARHREQEEQPDRRIDSERQVKLAS